MTALAEALLAAQRQAIGALSKAYVAGAFDGNESRAGAFRAALDEIGCTDAIDQGNLIASLNVLKVYGAPAPKATQPEPRGDDLETEAQRKLIDKLADERGLAAPGYKLTKANASKVIEELKAGTYNPDSWAVPF